MSGWVKLHRSLLKSRYGRNMEITGFFSTLLVMANWEKGYCADGTEIMPGQFMTSQLKLSDYFNCSRKKIKRLLDILESEQQISVLSSSKNSIITVINWDRFQGDESPGYNTGTSKEHQEHIKSTSKGTQYKKNNNNKNNNNIRLVKIASPLAPLFDGHEKALEIQAWLISGELNPQQKIFEAYDPEYLADVIEAAYDWQKENKKKRKAGRFIKDWIERDSRKKFKGGLTEFQAQLKAEFDRQGFSGYSVEA